MTAADIAALPELASVGDGGERAVFHQFPGHRDDRPRPGRHLSQPTLGAGDLGLTLAYNYNKNEVTNFDPAVIGPLQIITAEHLAPNHRANLQVGWANGEWAFNVVERYYSDVECRESTTRARSSARSSRPI